MTEQQEPAEETGLLSTQDLDPSKDDGTHGHFRQISQNSPAFILKSDNERLETGVFL